jgi:hypothetical protein
MWAAARVIVQQDVDEFLREAGPALDEQREALSQLMTEFDARCPDRMDPVLIRSYMRRHLRRIDYALKRDSDRPERVDETPELAESPATSPEGHAETHPESSVVPDDSVAIDGSVAPEGLGDTATDNDRPSGKDAADR